jgi:hypothetical protein
MNDNSVSGRMLCSGAVSSRVIAQNLQSDNFVSGTSGWRIERNTGNAEFGNVTIRGTLQTATISGNLTMDGTGSIQTASSGVRVVIEGGSNNWVSFYTDDSAELDPGYLVSSTGGTDGTTRHLRLAGVAPKINTNGKRIYWQLNSEYEDATVASRLTIGALTNGTGGSLVPYLYVEDPVEVYVETDVHFSETGNQFIEKLGSGDLYIDQRNNGANITLRADDSGGTTRSRITIDGDGVTRFYSNNGTSVMDIRTDHYVSVRNRLYLTQGGDDYIGYDDTNDVFQFAFDGTQRAAIEWTGSATRWIAYETNDYMEQNPTTEQWIWYLNDTQEMVLGQSGFVVPNVYSTTVTSSRDVEVDSTGKLGYVSSLLALKDNVKSADALADIDVTPVTFTWRNGGQHDIGFIADWLATQDQRLGVYDEDGDLTSYSLRRVVAVLAAKINRLEEKMENNCVCGKEPA